MTPMRPIRQTWEQVTRWLDELTLSVALTAGVVSFGALVLLLVQLSPWVFGVGLLCMVALLLWLAFSGQPVASVEFKVAIPGPMPEPEPSRLARWLPLSTYPLPAGGFEVEIPGPRSEPETTRRALDEPLEMVELAGGTFWLGSPETESARFDDEGPRHRVRVSAFAMGKVAVTQGLYREVMGENPSHFQGEDLPVVRVSWLDAVRFCNKLSERVGLPPCYRIDGEQVEWDRGADGYRLPTEAEREYGCRAGTETTYSFGDDPAELGEYAWYAANSEGRTQEVGQKQPNGWGLHDLHGNVYEWCWGLYATYKVTNDNDTGVDPIGPAMVGGRVLRGGAFNDVPRNLRAASRFWGSPGSQNRRVGFRCVRGSRRPL